MPASDVVEASRHAAADPRPFDARNLPGIKRRLSELTTREREVLRLVADGLTIAQIARRLHMSAGGTEEVVSSIFRKLGAEGTAEAILAAKRRGLLED